ncbi:MAG: hypothetical protein LBG44_07170 [Gemmatimonadota bacterium]|jgi:quercetin dioxygenase-like cupin family protein|nr:hypothetical protein [Gemmatimonadota bacterium]
MKQQPRYAPRRLATITGALMAAMPLTALAQAPTQATYLTAEQIATVNALPGVDRQIISTDIGKLNLAVGIVHRTAVAARPISTSAAAAADQACGTSSAADVPGTASGIAHDHQTETYIITSGSGTLVTGGSILNGRKSAPESSVTTTLNGPSCSGVIGGQGVISRVVKVGDVIVIPANVPHGWSLIEDHVDYLSVRPDPDRVLARDYVNPALD